MVSKIDNGQENEYTCMVCSITYSKMQDSHIASEDPDIDLESRLVDTCCDGDIETAIKITDQKTLPRASLEYGLYCALYRRQPVVARHLLDQNVQITSEVIIGAVQSEHLECFQLLVEHGWNVNDPVSDGSTVLMSVTVLSDQRRLSCQRMLTDKKCLHRAMLEHEAILNFLLSRGANPNLGPRLWNEHLDSSLIHNSGAALNAAAAHTSFATFQKLLNHGAKLENSIPLHAVAAAAADAERLPMMTELLKLGIGMNAEDEMMGPYSRGPSIVRAIESGGMKKTQFLLEHGAIVDERTLQAAEMAVSSANMGIINMLRQARAAHFKPTS